MATFVLFSFVLLQSAFMSYKNTPEFDRASLEEKQVSSLTEASCAYFNITDVKVINQYGCLFKKISELNRHYTLSP
jgi:hypothetical protein